MTLAILTALAGITFFLFGGGGGSSGGGGGGGYTAGSILAIAPEQIQSSSLSSSSSSSSSTALTPSSSTVVSSVFSTLSTKQQQEGSLHTLLSIKDSLILFVSPNLASTVTIIRRQHDPLLERTKIVSVEAGSLPVAQLLPTMGNVQWAELSKPWFLKEAARIDPFHSSYFLYAHLDAFANNDGETTTNNNNNVWRGQRIVAHPQPNAIVPSLEILFGGCLTENKNSAGQSHTWKDNQSGFYVHHSNMLIAGMKATIRIFYGSYMTTLKEMMEDKKSLNVLDSTVDDAAVSHLTCTKFALACVHMCPPSPTKDCQQPQQLLLSALHQDNIGGDPVKHKLWTRTGGLSDGNDPNKAAPLSTTMSDSKTLDSGSSLPSAKSLLTTKPPFDDSDLIKVDGANELITSPNTVVTAYFRVPSKFEPGKYDGWMENMLSLQDAMIIFTEPELVEQIKGFRKHAVHRTVIVPMAFNDLPFGTLYPASFWEDQMKRNPEKKIHKSYQLFWVWLSKSWCIAEAIRLNVFKSDFFVWSDIGCFRNKNYNGKTMILHPELIPMDRIVQMAHHDIIPPEDPIFNDKYRHKANFFHSGSQFAGYKGTLLRYHELFLETIDIFLQRKMIIVDDQLVAQSTCFANPDLCAYLPYKQVSDNNYFGLRFLLHYGGDDFKLWRPDQP